MSPGCIPILFCKGVMPWPAVVDGLMQPPPAAAASPVADPVAAAAPADAPAAAAAAAALASSAASSALILAKSSSPLRNISNGCIGISCRWFDSSKFGSPVVVVSAGMSCCPNSAAAMTWCSQRADAAVTLNLRLRHGTRLECELPIVRVCADLAHCSCTILGGKLNK